MKLCDGAAFLGSSFNGGHVDYLKIPKKICSFGSICYLL